MQAANERAKSAGALGSIGIRVELPFEQDVTERHADRRTNPH
jgi:hypothetical protein